MRARHDSEDLWGCCPGGICPDIYSGKCPELWPPAPEFAGLRSHRMGSPIPQHPQACLQRQPVLSSPYPPKEHLCLPEVGPAGNNSFETLSRDTPTPSALHPSSSKLHDVGPNLSSSGFLGHRLQQSKKNKLRSEDEFQAWGKGSEPVPT